MPHITRDLIRRKAEHNEGMVSTLEELSLHQEEIEEINGVLGASCRRLKILYLQNNIIGKMENLQHLKDLQYLNLALNNITRIEGLRSCEFLNKLDLTVNFIDLDEIRASVAHLALLSNLRELFLMGNPCMVDWEGCKTYIVGMLPQLEYLDGQEITHSDRLRALQELPVLEEELGRLEARKRREKVSETHSSKSQEDEDEDEELTEHTPSARTEMYLEIAEQKREQEERKRCNEPVDRDYEREHEEKRREERGRNEEKLERRREEEEGEEEEWERIRQCNEGKWEFFFDEDTEPGFLLLQVSLQRFLDTSLIDIDVHPTWISLVIKTKVLRLHLPSEVLSEQASAQRNQTTGALLVRMPTVSQGTSGDGDRMGGKAKTNTICLQGKIGQNTRKRESKGGGRTVYYAKPRKKDSIQEALLQAALEQDDREEREIEG